MGKEKDDGVAIDVTTASGLEQAFEHVTFLEFEENILTDNLELYDGDMVAMIKRYESYDEAVNDLREMLANYSFVIYPA